MAKLTEQDRERLRAQQTGQQPAAAPPAPARPHPVRSFSRHLRGWIDALFFAFLLAMFIRSYVFELFMIPTGSMTPTLIGDDDRNITEYDWDRDGQIDIVAQKSAFTGPLQVHLRNANGRFNTMLFLETPPDDVRRQFANTANPGKGRRDMIMVNKFAYWFRTPDRGDIIVFKVPDRPERGEGYTFSPAKPVYIKRCVGLPGEEILLRPVQRYDLHPPGHPNRITPDEMRGTELVLHSAPVLVDGEPLTTPPFNRLHHFPRPMNQLGVPSMGDQPETYEVGSREVLMLGDNQSSSLDSRYWGPVPTSHLRGKAVLRYLPMRAFGLLHTTD